MLEVPEAPVKHDIAGLASILTNIFEGAPWSFSRTDMGSGRVYDDLAGLPHEGAFERVSDADEDLLPCLISGEIVWKTDLSSGRVDAVVVVISVDDSIGETTLIRIETS